jgi:hypothetical protein
MTESENTPKRRLKLRHWIVIVFLTIVLGCVIAFFIYGSYAQRRLDRLIAQYQAAGEPILAEDFVSSGLPDESNAAAYWRAAVEGTKINPDDEKFLEKHYSHLLPLKAEEVEVLQQLAQANKDPLEDSRLAAALKESAWGIPFDPQNMLPDLPQVRTVARLLRWSAVLEHHNGNHDQSIARVRQIIALSDSAQNMSPGIISHLIGIGVSTLGSDCIAELSPDLKIGPETGAAKVEDIRALIAALLDESTVRRGWSDGANGERALVLHHGRIFGTKPVVGPYFRVCTADMLEESTKYRDAGLLSNLPAALADTKALREAPPPKILNVMAFLSAHLDRKFHTHFRGLCERRMAAVALSIRLYRADHNGQLPKSLDELVPTYLPKLPADPFRDDGKTFGYVPTGDPPAIYSVADNGTDEKASTQPAKRGVRTDGDFNRWDRQDAVMYLVRLPKPAPETEE